MLSSAHVGIALAAYFAIVLVLSVLPPMEVRSRWVQILRIALPSWRFFEELGDVPRLSYRGGTDESRLGAWRPALRPLHRSVRRLLYNPDGNLALACESLLQQLLADLQDLDEARDEELEAAVSYRLTRNLAALRAREDGAAFYQFKLDVVSAADESSQEALISPVYRC